jgi:hypothetical protein
MCFRLFAHNPIWSGVSTLSFMPGREYIVFTYISGPYSLRASRWEKGQWQCLRILKNLKYFDLFTSRYSVGNMPGTFFEFPKFAKPEHRQVLALIPEIWVKFWKEVAYDLHGARNTINFLRCLWILQPTPEIFRFCGRRYCIGSWRSTCPLILVRFACICFPFE